MSIGSWARPRGRTWRPRRFPRRLPRARALLVVLGVGLVAWLGWLWYQGSGFVRIRHVNIVGLGGPDVAPIRQALISTAMGMTTMKLQVSRLEQAVAGYPYIESITVSSHGAHTVTIDVVEQLPVALIESGGQGEVVDSRDQILAQSAVPHGLLPQVSVALPPTGDTITEPATRAVIAVLANAPYALLPHIARAEWSAGHGVIVQMRSGPALYFGPTVALAQKWQDAIAVLQNSSSAGAAYIDLSDPGRPAAGVSVTPQQAQSIGLEPGASAAGNTAAASPTASAGTDAAATPATAAVTPAATATSAATATADTAMTTTPATVAPPASGTGETAATTTPAAAATVGP